MGSISTGVSSTVTVRTELFSIVLVSLNVLPSIEALLYLPSVI